MASSIRKIFIKKVKFIVVYIYAEKLVSIRDDTFRESLGVIKNRNLAFVH